MYNPYDQISIEETIPVDYEEWLDEYTFDNEGQTVKWVDDTICIKCDAHIGDFELDINDGRCPCCDSILVEKDIPI